jgi:DNA-binding CsgD family transcriptional regulator/pimeloyl-ACP methyl ester carboxylesterase
MGPRVEYARASDGTTVAFSSTGQGPALVLLPTVPFSNFVDEWWVPTLRAAFEGLASRFRLIQYDGRGTGHSQRDVSDVSLDAMVGDLDAVLRQAGVGSAGLLAQFNACPQAIAFAARHRSRVGRIALYGGAARGWLPMSSDQTQALLSLIERDWRLFTETAAHAWMGWGAGDAGRLAAESFRQSVTPAVARAILQAASAVDVTDLLADVEQPTLVLHKPRGLEQLEEEAARDLAQRLPRGRFVSLAGETAALFQEDGAAVVEMLGDFFAGGEPIVTWPPTASRSDPTAGILTPRESEVLRWLAAGDSNAEIAHRLGISTHTVERHIANLYRKIDARGRADATAWALRRGIA